VQYSDKTEEEKTTEEVCTNDEWATGGPNIEEQGANPHSDP